MASAEILIAEHLNTWSSAIKAKVASGRGGGKKQELYGIKKLRKLILELAVRGLLIPQNSSERSAAECLETSCTGIPSFDKILDQPAPSGWVSLELGRIIASNIGGGTPSKSNPGYWGGEIPWASVKDIQMEKFIDSTIDTITADGLKNSSSNLIPPNRLLVVTRMGLGKLAINKCAMAINQDLRAIEPISALDLDYGYLLFKALNLVGKGVTVKGVKVKELHAIHVLLPPFEEQHRIVAKVDELMELCDQLEQQQEDSLQTHQTLVKTLLGALTTASESGQFDEAWKRIESNFDTLFTTESSIDELKQTILQLAVIGKLVPQNPNDEPASELLKKIATEKAALIKTGEIKKQKALPSISDKNKSFDTPNGWTWCHIGDICKISSGKGFLKSEYTEKGVRLFQIANVSTGKTSWEVTVNIPESYINDYPKLLLQEGDLVIALNRPLLGRKLKIAILKATDVPAILYQRVGRFDMFDRTLIPFLFSYLNSEWFSSWLFNQIRGINIPFVNQSKVHRHLIPIPPLAEQQRIVAKVDELMALCDQLKAGLQTAQNIQLNLADTLTHTTVSTRVNNPCNLTENEIEIVEERS